MLAIAHDANVYLCRGKYLVSNEGELICEDHSGTTQEKKKERNKGAGGSGGDRSGKYWVLSSPGFFTCMRRRARSAKGKRMGAGENDGYDRLLPRSTTIATVNHLFVFHHGMWGVSGHLDYIAETVVKTHKSPEVNIFPLMVKKNEIFRSYSGIRACAHRLKEEIEEEMDRLEEVISHISFVGYSAGGLICRYCLGLLEDNGFFEKVIPVNFFLFASPNAGIHRFPTSPHFLTNLNYRVFNWFSSRLGWFIGWKTCV